MKRYIALLTAIAVWQACASTPPPEPSDARPVARTRRALREEFKPIRKDLLLIQPVFSQPAAEGDEVATQPVAPAASAPILPPEIAYRVQVMALSNEQTARMHATELQKSLGVPVQVEGERHLYIVRAGAFARREEAENLRQEIERRSPSYADAFVLVPAQSAAAESSPVESAEWDAAEEEISVPAEVVEEVVPAPVTAVVFGWRVLLDQFNRHADAAKLQRDARRRLGRDDIYVTFNPPWYKVEVGNYLYETKAREEADRLKRRGYKNALKVRGKITVVQEQR